MPNNNILLFDQNKQNMMSDQNYATNSQRLGGVQQGIASSQLQNKTLYQVSLVAYALAQLMNANGLDASDADQVSTFVSNMSLSIMQKVLDKATSAEAQAGVATGKWVSPATMKAACLFLSGGTMTGNIAMGNHKVTGLAAPTNNGDAATKQYVDVLSQVVEMIPVKFYENETAVPKTYPARGSEGYFRDFDVVLEHPINMAEFDVIKIKTSIYGLFLVGSGSMNATALEVYLLDSENSTIVKLSTLGSNDNEQLTFPLPFISESILRKAADGAYERSTTVYGHVAEFESGLYVPAYRPKWKNFSITKSAVTSQIIDKIRFMRNNTQYQLQTFGAVAEIKAIKYANRSANI